MPKTRKSLVLLLLITCFSALYRVFLVFRDGFPPGADIGLHGSLIHSITQGGNVNFMWNIYHMGGGTSNTFPGYHIFTAAFIFFTGLPDYLAEALAAIIFSTLIVAVTFLLTRKILNESVALIASFFMGVSFYDIYMVLWSGYPNIVTLMLIPLVFYLFLEKSRFTSLPFISAASLLCAAIFLTHSLSAAIFVVIVLASVLAVLCFPGHSGLDRKAALGMIIPLFAGALLVSPFLLQAAPFYLNLNSPVYTGGLRDLQALLLPNRIVPMGFVWPFFAFFFLGFLLFRYLPVKPKFSVILLASWLIIPTVLTQSYLAGFYTDYERFLYFAVLPLTILVAAGVFLGARLLSKGANRFSAVKKHLSFTRAVTVFAVILIVLVCFELPHFSLTLSEGVDLQGQLQFMNTQGYDGIQWVKYHTPTDSVVVSDAMYGWWLGGFAQRRAVAAMDPIFITNSREFEPAKLIGWLLDTDYLVDNGLIQVREDGGYVGRQNPEFLAKLNSSYYPLSFLYFNNSQTAITYTNGEETRTILASQLSVKETRMENTSEYASIIITSGNEFFNFTQKTTVYKGAGFVEMTETLSSNNQSVNFGCLSFKAQTRGNLALGNGDFATLDDPSVNVAGQLIFPKTMPTVRNASRDSFEINYNLTPNSNAEVSFYVSVFEYPALNSQEATQTGLQEKFIANTKSYTQKSGDAPLDVLDYRQALEKLNVSYVALRDFSQQERFANDPIFTLEYVNEEVAIFRVNTHSPQQQPL
jgi:hypothetical protein